LQGDQSARIVAGHALTVGGSGCCSNPPGA
jgi:hypothetical protein